VRCCLCDPTFSRFSRTPTCVGRTDRQTDRRTDRHRVMANTADAASRGKNRLKRKYPHIYFVGYMFLILKFTDQNTTTFDNIYWYIIYRNGQAKLCSMPQVSHQAEFWPGTRLSASMVQPPLSCGNDKLYLALC